MSDAAPLRVLYIGGAGRSGSTLLGNILGARPRTFHAGEVTHLWRRGVLEDQLCGCGEPFSRCPFWRDVVARIFDSLGMHPGDLARIVSLRDEVCSFRALPQLLWPWLQSSDFRRSLSEYGAALVEALRAIQETSGVEVVVDSSKYPPEALVLAGRGDVRLSLLHLVRHVGAVAYAWTKTKERPEIHDRRAYFSRYPVPKTAAAWVTFNAVFERMARSGSLAAHTRVRYEDLVETPSATLAKIARELDLTPRGGWCLDGRSVHLGPNHTVSGNPVRFRQGPVQLVIDDDWREAMPGLQRLVADGLGVLQLRRYGYSGREAEGRSTG